MKSMRRERSADMSDDLNTVSTATGKVSVNGIPVPDDLRTRIATVIRREVPCHPPAADRIADAVIRELKPYGSDEYIDYDDGHAGGYPHHHRVLVIDMGLIDGGQTKQYGPSPKITTRKADDAI